MYIIPIDQIERLLACVQTALPREASGLLLKRELPRCAVLSFAATSNQENTPLSFRIRDEAIEKIAASLKGSGVRTCGCFHSHVFGAARPSRQDCAAAKEPGDLWLIYSARFRSLNLFGWDGAAFQKKRFRVTPPMAAPPSTGRRPQKRMNARMETQSNRKCVGISRSMRNPS